MTIEELYEWADENNVLKYQIAVPFGKNFYRISDYPFEVAIDKERKIVVIGEDQESYDDKERRI